MMERACRRIVNLPSNVSWSFTITNEDGEGTDPTTPSLDIGAPTEDTLLEIMDSIKGTWEKVTATDRCWWWTTVADGIEVTVMGPDTSTQTDLFNKEIE